MDISLNLTLNGQPAPMEGLSPNVTLLEFLRARGLTGTKEGCAEGDCGACSVVVLGQDAEGRATWRAINSCLVPAVCLAGQEVRTVEGISTAGQSHPAQRCLAERHGSQCGYCTPGIVMSIYEACHRPGLRADWQLDDQLSGNLCRCTGYRPIREAAAAAVAETGTPAVASAPSAPAVSLEYGAGDERFFRPRSLEELQRLRRRHPEARWIAGGTEIGLQLTKRYQRFRTWIALDALPELQGIRETPDHWAIGAGVPLSDLEDHARLAAEYPALLQMLRLFGSRQIRNRATLGGNLATASPIGDAAPLLLALDARLLVAGGRRREIPLARFFTGYRKTALRDRELIGEVLVPRGTAVPGTVRHAAFHKVSRRREMDIATVSACFVVDMDERGIVRYARLAYGGVAATPARARRTERALVGRPWTEATLARVLPGLAAEFQPISDVRGSVEYRRGLITALFEKFFHEAGATPAPAPPESARISPVAPPAGVASAPQESAWLHVSGAATYADDQTAGMLEVWPVCAPHAHARIMRRDASVARAMPGVRAVLLAEDAPGINDVGPVRPDEPLLAHDLVSFHGQMVALVVGDSPEACRAAAAQVVVEYEPLPPVLSIARAIEQDSFHTTPHHIRRGEPEAQLASAPQRLSGEFEMGGQDHFYLETQAAWAKPGEGGTMHVMSSTQHPTEVQHAVARVLGVADHRVTVQVPRVGGGFGGKETQAAAPAALAALAAQKTGRAVRVRFNRDQDMALTGKRHPFLARFEVGFDHDGALRALRVELFSDGGWSLDLSQAVCDRALLHLDNAYFIPHADFSGRVGKTHLASNTAFRGFGGPQGMLVIEEILDRIARRLGVAPERVRERNLYRTGGAVPQSTPYGQVITEDTVARVWDELRRDVDFAGRRVAIRDWNATHPHRKRGLAITPVKFGISFTALHLNQAGALVLLYADGSAQVNHGGIEMGQGLNTNIRAVAARELGLSLDRVRVMATRTDKVPNTSPTAASSGTDLNGAAVKDACDTLRARLAPVAAGLLGARAGCTVAPEDIEFADDTVFARGEPGQRVPLPEVTRRAWLDRISLAATGFYRTPDIHFDWNTGQGRPFHYFAVGAAVSEVEVDGFTGMMQVRRVDILHDAGASIHPAVNLGQIEGGFVQGMGWLTCEELKWDANGRLLTHSPDTYKIPAAGDAPREFYVKFLADSAHPGVIHGSKAVGEPPLMLAISVREAIRDAVAAFGPVVRVNGAPVELSSPATSEAIFRAVQRERGRPSSRENSSDAADRPRLSLECGDSSPLS